MTPYLRPETMSPNIRRKLLFSCASALAGLSLACGPIGSTQENLDPLAKEFAYEPLAMDPVTATAVGYHSHERDGGAVALDEELGDYSPAGISKRVEFYKDFRRRLSTHESNTDPSERDKMNKDRWVNYGVLENRIDRALHRLEQEQPFANDPNFYIEILGNGLIAPLTMNYAAADQRYGHIVARLEKVPDFLATAKTNLKGASKLQAEAAREEIRGLINMIREDVPTGVPAGLKGRFDPAASAAIAALEDYAQHVAGVANRDDWRMGASLFEGKLVAAGGPKQPLQDTLNELQAEYDEAYKQVIAAARPIHRRIYGGQSAPNDFALMRDILDVVSDDNRLRDGSGLVDRLREDVDAAKAYLRAEEVAPIPDVPLTIAETPSFLRAKFPVDAFQAPPLLSPSQGANYWITPIPANWDRARMLAKLREYNNFKLKIVAVDGYARYVQAALASENPDEVSRLIRNVDANRAYTRGWVWYLVDSTMNLGYQAGNEQFKMTWWKYKLEFLANAILDIKLHTANMSEDEARTLLQRQVFLEAGAVDSAVRRIQLTPTEATLSFVGAKEWQKAREEYQEATTDFSLQSFHGKALRAGAMPAAELVYATTMETR